MWIELRDSLKCMSLRYHRQVFDIFKMKKKLEWVITYLCFASKRRRGRAHLRSWCVHRYSSRSSDINCSSLERGGDSPTIFYEVPNSNSSNSLLLWMKEGAKWLLKWPTELVNDATSFTAAQDNHKPDGTFGSIDSKLCRKAPSVSNLERCHPARCRPNLKRGWGNTMRIF